MNADPEVREITPYDFRFGVAFGDDDVKAANISPQLFFDIFGPGWEGKKISERLHLAAALAELVENAGTNLNLSGTIEPR